MRDLMLRSGALAPVLAVLEDVTNKVDTRRIAVWTVSNLVRGKIPRPAAPEYLAAAIPILAKTLKEKDPQIVSDSCWSVSYCEGQNQLVIDTGESITSL